MPYITPIYTPDTRYNEALSIIGPSQIPDVARMGIEAGFSLEEVYRDFCGSDHLRNTSPGELRAKVVEAFATSRTSEPAPTDPAPKYTAKHQDEHRITTPVREAVENDQEKPTPLKLNRFSTAMITGGAQIDEQFEQLKSQKWTVKKWIPGSAKLIEFYGTPGSFKSFIVLFMALCIAIGKNWYGHAVRQCRVVFIPAEGQSGTLKRVMAWLAYHNICSSELDLFTILPRPCLIDQPGELKALIEAITSLPDPPVGFIVIDTLARSMCGDENSTSDMGNVVTACSTLSEETNGAQVALVHHTGKDVSRGPRGAIALTGATDVLINVQKRHDRGALIHCERQKDDEPPEDMLFDMVLTSTGHLNDEGEELSSLVPVLDANSTTTKKSPHLRGANRIALDALDKALTDHGQPPCNELKTNIKRDDIPDMVVQEEDWRTMAYDMGISEGENAAKKMAFKRSRTYLMDQSAVACFGGFYWKPTDGTKGNKR